MPRKKPIKLEAQEMLKAGLHFGHRTSRVHPKMFPFIYGMRNTVHIIDLEKTKEKLEQALEFVEGLMAEGKTLLLVGTKVSLKDLVKEKAQDLGLPYVTERWLGGTFTNFGVLKKRIDYFKGLEEKKKKGELEKYTKKEQLDFEKELQDLELKYGGIKEMEELPDAIFVVDMRKDSLAVKEARMKGIKVIAIADTNVDPSLADYPIPANDDAISSVRYILEKLKEATERAKIERAKIEQAKKKKKKS